MGSLPRSKAGCVTGSMTAVDAWQAGEAPDLVQICIGHADFLFDRKIWLLECCDPFRVIRGTSTWSITSWHQKTIFSDAFLG
jgi:hypothetical protein